MFNIYLWESAKKASLPEWSKGADLRSAELWFAWVQTPQDAKYNFNFIIIIIIYIPVTYLKHHFDTDENKQLGFVEITPIIQVISIIYLLYLFIFKKDSKLIPFFIIYAINSLILVNPINLFNETKLNRLWYKINILYLFLFISCFIIYFFIKK